MSDTITPAPGSDEAIAAKCRCPRIDNCRGQGYQGVPGLYIYSADCPLHGHLIRLDDEEDSE